MAAKPVEVTEPVKIVRKPKVPGAFRESRYRHMMTDMEGRMREYQREVEWWLTTDEEYFKARVPFDSLADLDAKVGRILDEEGIIGTDRIKYLNFARKLWKLAYTYTFVKSSTVNSLRALYRSLGAKERILKRIEQLFTVPLIEEREEGAGAGAPAAAAPISE
jgi:hypothetical protein